MSRAALDNPILMIAIGLVLVALVAGLVRLPRRPALLRLARAALLAGDPRRCRALARLGKMRSAPRFRPAFALCEAHALLWEGERTRALARIDALQRLPNHGLGVAPILVRLECLLFDQRAEEARALFDLHAGAVRSSTDGAADALAIEGFLAFYEGDLEAAKAKLEAVYTRTSYGDPIVVAADFCLAAIAHRTERREDTRRHLTEAIRHGGNLFVGGWAESQWTEIFVGEETPPREQRSTPKRRRRSAVPTFAADLLGGLGVLFFRTAAIRRRRFTLGGIALLTLLDVAVIVGLRAVDYERGEEVYPLGVIALVAPLFFFPLTAAIATSGRQAMLRVLGGFYAALPALLAAAFFVTRLSPTRPRLAVALEVMLALWALVAVVRLARASVADLGLVRLFACAAAFIATWLVPMHVVGSSLPSFPSRPSLEEYQAERRARGVRQNAIAFAQAERLATEIGAIELGRPGVTDLYFVGGAGWGDQDVFLREVRSARQVFDRRFDTTGRSLLLANDPSTEDNLPLAANVTLRRALREVGERMNVDEDILFLFLTSHGSADGLALGFGRHGPFQDEQLEPEELRAMLDAAHIKWRVLVVSGCESGVFVAPLKDDFTLLATAASSDRPSYGCAAGNEFTEFGKALFGQELLRERSFVAAFRSAVRIVGEREAAEKRPASRPQIFQGPAIEAKLRELEIRLADTSSAAADKPR